MNVDAGRVPCKVAVATTSGRGATADDWWPSGPVLGEPGRLRPYRTQIKYREVGDRRQQPAAARQHGVGEALYLRDSDDQGMELYCDWPRELWPVSAKGELDMVSHRLDLRALLAEPGTAQCDSRRRT